MRQKMTLGGWIESLEKTAAAAAAETASTELHTLDTLEEGDIFRLAPVSEEEVRQQIFAVHGEVPTDEELQTCTESERFRLYDGLRDDVWYRFIAGPDDVGCYSFAALDDHWDYHEQPGDLLVQKPVGKRIKR